MSSNNNQFANKISDELAEAYAAMPLSVDKIIIDCIGDEHISTDDLVKVLKELTTISKRT